MGTSEIGCKNTGQDFIYPKVDLLNPNAVSITFVRWPTSIMINKKYFYLIPQHFFHFVYSTFSSCLSRNKSCLIKIKVSIKQDFVSSTFFLDKARFHFLHILNSIKQELILLYQDKNLD